MKDETFGNKVVIQMYHNTPPTRPISEVAQGSPWMRVVWDSNAEEAAQIAGSDPGVARAYHHMVIQWLEGDFPSHDLPYGMEPGAAIFHLLGRDEQMKELADLWRGMIEMEAENGQVTGDDTYFDYFPDFMNGLRQLCEQIDYPAAYNSAQRFVTAKGAPYDPEHPAFEDELIPPQL
jgi:hypothetical protein